MKLPRALARPRRAPALALVLMLAAALPAAAAESGRADIPAYEGYVNDRAGVMGEPRRAQLEAFLDQFHAKTGAQFAVLTMTTTAPEDPDAYKVRVFETWGIGSKERDDGLLLLLAMEERRIVFETGYGLEGTLPDGWQAGMLRDLAVPRLREGNAEEGVTAAVLAAAQRVAAEKGVTLEWNGEELRYSGRRGRSLPPWVALLIVLLIFMAVSSAARHGGFGGGGSGGGGGGASW